MQLNVILTTRLRPSVHPNYRDESFFQSCMPAMKVYDFVFGHQLENIEIVNSEQTLIFFIYCDIGYPWLKHKLFGNNRFIFIMYSN